MSLHDILFLAAQVAVIAVVTYTLRALPFLLLSRAKQTPRAVQAVSAWISPIIIFALIVWSYTGLAWQLPAPWIAGAVAIVLQLLTRSPLVSILVSTVLYMYLIA